MVRIEPDDEVFVLTGAGVSAESGLPTFRGMNGIWQNHRIEEVASPVAWRRDPQMVWEFYSMRREVHAGKKPNAAHLALAELQSRLDGRFFLCTQNVDELHEQAGSENVDRQMYGPSAEIPTCPCGGRLRPHIVWFGEEPFEMARIVAAAERCTLFVAIGTSGLVEPAASLVRIARRRNSGVRSVYVGPEEPANAAEFSECVLAAAAEVLPGLFQIS
jgi:NAD-dependent deacetylase